MCMYIYVLCIYIYMYMFILIKNIYTYILCSYLYTCINGIPYMSCFFVLVVLTMLVSHVNHSRYMS